MKKVVENFIQLATKCAILIICGGIVACGSDSEEGNSGGIVGNNTNTVLSNGFVLSDIGTSYATFEISTENLKKLFLERLGVPTGTGVDLSAYGLNNNYETLLPEMVYIGISETTDFEKAYKTYGELSNGKVIYNLQLKGDTKYYYQIFSLTPDGKIASDGKTYELKTNGFNPSNVSITTGKASTSNSNLSYYYIKLEESTIMVNNINTKELLQFGVTYSSSKTDLQDNNIINYINADHGGYKDVVWYYPMNSLNYLSDYDKTNGMTNVTFSNGCLIAKISPRQLMNFKNIENYYYRIFVELGGIYVLGELGVVSKYDKS